MDEMNKLKAIRNDMWAMYNKEKSINGVTELINKWSKILLYQIDINEKNTEIMQEISKRLDGIQESNDRKGKTR